MSFNKSRTVFDCPPNCPERKPACQDHCERYAEKRALHDELMAKEKQRRDVENYIRGGHMKANDLWVKRRKNKRRYFGYTD